MAEIGLGYGSEYQLLRFLGHHRQEFESIIRNSTRFQGNFEWIDFPYNNNRLSLDGENVGISFLKKNIIDLNKNWKEFWPQTGTSQNWDAILIHDGEYVLVEAKARIGEIHQSCDAKGLGRKKIKEALDATRKSFSVESKNDWLLHNYQLANRLAFIKFLLSNNIKASLLNIYFVNGYIKRDFDKRIIENKSVLSQIKWEEKIIEQYKYLGITNTMAMDYINSVFINCIK